MFELSLLQVDFSTPQNAINYVQLIPWSQLSHTVLGGHVPGGRDAATTCSSFSGNVPGCPG